MLIYIGDVCGDAFVNGSSKPVLRRIITNENGNHLPILNISYLPVRKTSITEIELYITDEYGNLRSFISEAVSITLHFRLF